MKRYKKLIIFFVLSIFFTCSLSSCFFRKPKQQDDPLDLRFNQNGEFVVLHLADLHECLHLRDTLREVHIDFITRVINETNPDLIVLGGDNIFPLSTLGEIVKKETLITIDAIANLLDSTKTPWTMIFGNHDDEAIYDKVIQLERYRSSSKYFIGGLTDGEYFYAFHDEQEDMVGNFIIPVKANDDTRIAYNIIGLDSGSRRKNGYDYNFIKDSQINWYKSTSDLIKQGNGGINIPAIAFTHIPLHEHKYYYNNRANNEMVLDWVGNYGGYALSDYDCNFFEACVDKGDVRGIFSGHNHSNSFTAICLTEKSNIILSVTRQAGLYNQNELNSRVIVLNENGGFYTYEYQTEPLNTIEYR